MVNFKVKLARTLELEGEWEAALVRFSFTNSLCTFNSTQVVYLSKYPSNKQSEIIIAPQRFRNIEHLIEVINKSVQENINVGEGDKLPFVELDHNNRTIMRYTYIGEKLYHLEFSPHLEIILGIDRQGCHYLDAFRTDMYVYLDIISQKIVGDCTVPLLSIVDIGDMETARGDQAIFKIKRPEYTKIIQSRIDEVEVQILNDAGAEPILEFGSVSLTLHLRRKNDD